MSGAVFFAALWTLLNGISDALPVLFAALLHEGGHALMCRCLRVPIRFFSPSVAGAVIGYDASVLSYGQEIAVAAAGPFVNLFSAVLSLGCTGRGAALFGISSLALALFNLLPLRRLDGGVILYAALVSMCGVRRGERIAGVISAVGTVFLWMCAVAVQLRCGGNLSLLLVSVYLLLAL